MKLTAITSGAPSHCETASIPKNGPARRIIDFVQGNHCSTRMDVTFAEIRMPPEPSQRQESGFDKFAEFRTKRTKL